ncbi:MAG: hypothetical protein DI586_11000 [Micavibrio aeruginosavorus]|uniref:HTH cro/C1-type domain-containing protein n=1 Tax=Micavibrio aeruginosavorus TaxID=349221 RepID=A0A2W5FEW1_9BACT|nr:MAG: hypothetical protein DI586_11000 [Micavibrio aeruginosavorus]
MISNLENLDECFAKVVGHNIRRLRENARLSRHDLARILSISYQQLYKYERGQNRISAVNLVYLKFHLDADYNEFFKDLF